MKTLVDTRWQDDVSWVLAMLQKRHPARTRGVPMTWAYGTNMLTWGAESHGVPYESIADETAVKEYPYGGEIARDMERRFLLLHYIEQVFDVDPEHR